MPLSSITPSASLTGTTGTASASGGLTATSDTFLKLLVTNLQHQDPTKPQDSNEYVAQISQMTMVEKLTALAKDSSDAANDQRIAGAVALLGRTVSYVGKDGMPATGTVAKVDVSGTTPTITVDTVDGVDPTSVTTVA